MNQKYPKTIQRYQLQDQIGHGAFAIVHKGIHVPSSLPVAIKVIQKQNPKSDAREYQILQKLHHPNIIELFDVLENQNFIYIVMEYLPQGSLRDYLIKHKRMHVSIVRKIFGQLVSAIVYLHSKNICHRDIKCSNCLIDGDNNVKLIDFGLATKYEKFIFGFCGSLNYAAPELIKGETYSSKVDVWSLGVLLYTLLVGSRPFEDNVKSILTEKILNFEPHYPSDMDPLQRSLVRSMLEKNPRSRISIQEVFEHAWVHKVSIPKQTTWRVDEHIMTILRFYGIQLNTVRQDLFEDRITSSTAFYKILRKYPDLCQNISTNRQFNCSIVKPSIRDKSERSSVIGLPKRSVSNQPISKLPKIISNVIHNE